jgi:hypothetical protein
MIWWAIVFQTIEYVSALITFRLFIFEEICQSGNVQLFINTNSVRTKPTGFILQKIFEHAYYPALETIDYWGWICPWAKEVFGNYFAIEKVYLDLYRGLE